MAGFNDLKLKFPMMFGDFDIYEQFQFHAKLS